MATIVVGFGLLLALAGSDDSGALYTEQLRKQALDLSLKSESYRGMVLRIGSVDRIVFDTTTNNLLLSIDAAEALLASAPEDPQYTAPVMMFGSALEQWREGVESVRETTLAIADGQGDVGSAGRATNALVDLRVGDRAYLAFVALMGTAQVSQPVSTFPSVSFLPADLDIPALGQLLVASASNPATLLRLRADLTIEQVLTIPEMILNTDQAFGITATDTLGVKVVVRNDGNADSEPFDLAIVLIEQGATLADQVKTVGQIGPQEQTTITFESLTVKPGMAYRLVVSLPLLEGEQVTEDNQEVFDFVVNEPVTSTTTGP